MARDALIDSGSLDPVAGMGAALAVAPIENALFATTALGRAPVSTATIFAALCAGYGYSRRRRLGMMAEMKGKSRHELSHAAQSRLKTMFGIEGATVRR